MAPSARIIIVAVVVAAIVILLLVSGWANDEAKPGSTGRVPVTQVTTSGR